MEGRKFYAVKANANSALTSKERAMIAICNSAMIGAAKCLNRVSNSHLSREDMEDIYSDAILAALTHVNPETTGCLSYADKCGTTTAIKKSQKSVKENSIFTRLDINDDNDGWSTNYDVMTISDEVSADSIIDAYDRNESGKKRLEADMQYIATLSEQDQMLIKLKMANLAYKEIAKKMGCSEGAVQKRAHDIKTRFNKFMSSPSYQSLY